jgi:uncharacterized damage-inducible protein DinB
LTRPAAARIVPALPRDGLPGRTRPISPQQENRIMQNRQSFLGWWEHFRQVNGITLRIVSAMTDEQIAMQPIKNMRTPKELLVHMYGQLVRNVTLGITTGEIQGYDEKTACASIKTRAELEKFCLDCWNAGNTAAQSVTDAQLQASVKTPWGMDMPGAVCAGVICDEYLHHRGQLYAFARALGMEPPMLWDFGHNTPEFAPKQAATA